MWNIFSERMVSICNEKKKHVKCIQDPLGVDYLYTKTGCVRKGGINAHHSFIEYIPHTNEEWESVLLPEYRNT